MPKKGPLNNLNLPSVDDLHLPPLDDSDLQPLDDGDLQSLNDGDLQPLNDLGLPRVEGGGLNLQDVWGPVPVGAIGYKIAKLNRKSPPEFRRLPWGTMMSEI
jgi:hypothetical protein